MKTDVIYTFVVQNLMPVLEPGVVLVREQHFDFYRGGGGGGMDKIEIKSQDGNSPEIKRPDSALNKNRQDGSFG